MTAGKVLLCKLYERRSQRGNEYMIGRLGAATVICFKDESTELREGTLAVWNVYLQEPTDSGQRRQATEGGQDQQPARPISYEARRPRPTHTIAAPKRKASSATPDPDDGIADLWPGG